MSRVLLAFALVSCHHGSRRVPPPLAAPVPEVAVAANRNDIVLDDATVAYRSGDLASTRRLLNALEGDAWAAEQPKLHRLRDAMATVDRWPRKALLRVEWVRGGPIAFEQGLVLIVPSRRDDPQGHAVLSKLFSEASALEALGVEVVLMAWPHEVKALEETFDRHEFVAATTWDFSDFAGRDGAVLLEDGVVRWIDVGVGFGHSGMVAGILSGARPSPPGDSPWAPPTLPDADALAADQLAFREEAERAGQPVETLEAEKLALGARVYREGDLACAICHGYDGVGVPGAFPPLVGQAAHLGDCETTARQVIHGVFGQIVVDGVVYDGVMPPLGAMLDDAQVSAVSSYVRQSWGNAYGFCATRTATAARAMTPGSGAR